MRENAFYAFALSLHCAAHCDYQHDRSKMYDSANDREVSDDSSGDDFDGVHVAVGAAATAACSVSDGS
jgi:hypothetical protein